MFLLLAIAAIIVLVYYYIKQFMTHWEKAGVPSIKPIFLIGNLKEVSQKRHLSEVLFDFYKEFKGKGPFGGIYFFTKPVAILTDLDFIKKVLVKDFSNFSDRGAYFNEKDDPLSAHLFSIEGAKWKNLREKMTPTFTSGKMKMMFPTIVDVGNNFVDTLNREALSGKVEIKELLARFTTDTIGSCAFGIDCDSLKNPQAEFRTMGRKIFDRSAFIILKRFCIVMSKKFANFVGITTTHPEVAKFFLNVVKETIQYREENNVTRKDFLQLMMQIKNHGEIEGENSTNIKTGLITVNEIAAQAFIMYLAGRINNID